MYGMLAFVAMILAVALVTMQVTASLYAEALIAIEEAVKHI